MFAPYTVFFCIHLIYILINIIGYHLLLGLPTVSGSLPL